jgi:hypothetical protein
VPVAEAPAKEWSVEARFDYFSQYIFRGFQISDKALLAPHAIGKWKWFAATYYGYFSEWDAPGNRWYVEHDFTLDATAKLGRFSFTGGALCYEYPHGKSDGTDTWELYGIATYDFPLLNPKLTFNWDVDAFHTGYGTASISHGFAVTPTLTVTPSAAVGVFVAESGRARWNDALLGVSANLVLNQYVSLHAGVQFSLALDNLDDLGQGNETIGNVGITFTF